MRDPNTLNLSQGEVQPLGVSPELFAERLAEAALSTVSNPHYGTPLPGVTAKPGTYPLFSN